MAWGVLLLMNGAALGLGAALLKALRILPALGPWERFPWAFALGFGALGWLGFMLGTAGLYAPIPLWLLALLPLPGLLWLGGPGPLPRFGALGWVLLAGLGVIAGIDWVETLAPPTDGDSLAYHFALPRQYLAAGLLEFTPRAVDGAAAKLVQMTYVPALGLGGERGLLLWVMTSGWWTGALLFALLRRHVGLNPALAVTAVYLTVPAVVYGGGSGQVEVRNALFVLVGAYATGLALVTGLRRYALLAGLAAGFFAGGKFLGLLFVGAAGLTILFQRRWLLHGTLFGLAALAAGGQWYLWLWHHTGDPVFPILYQALGLPDGPYWSQAASDYFKIKGLSPQLHPIPSTAWGFLTYPVIATLAGHPMIESKRTGFGPFIWLLLPFVLAAVGRHARSWRESPLFGAASATLIFYGVWFFSAPTQLVRHLLPVLPPLLLVTSVLAFRWAEAGGSARMRPLVGIVVLTLGLQGAGALLFSLNPLRYALSGQTREAYVARVVAGGPMLPWLNANLGPEDRLFHGLRQLNYHLDVPYFFAHAAFQKVIEVRVGEWNPARFWRQSQGAGVSHFLIPESAGGGGAGQPELAADLAARGCVRVQKRFEDVPFFQSRTLQSLDRKTETMLLWRATPGTCGYR